MRIKAIPGDIEAFAEKHTLALLLGGAAIVYGGYVYINNRSPTQSVGADAPASTSIPAIYSMPQIMGGGSTGMVDSAVNPNAPTIPAGPSGSGGSGGTDLDWAMFNLEKTKQEDDFSLAQHTLDAQLQIAMANAQVAMAGVQTAQWQADAGIAQAFLMSGSQFFAGNIGGQLFGFVAGGGAKQVYQGKNQKRIVAMQNQQYNDFMSQFGQELFGNVQPSTGTQSTSSFANVSTFPSVQPGGSSSITTVYAGTGAGSAQSSTGGGGSSGGGTGTTLVSLTRQSSA